MVCAVVVAQAASRQELITTLNTKYSRTDVQKFQKQLIEILEQAKANDNVPEIKRLIKDIAAHYRKRSMVIVVSGDFYQRNGKVNETVFATPILGVEHQDHRGKVTQVQKPGIKLYLPAFDYYLIKQEKLKGLDDPAAKSKLRDLMLNVITRKYRYLTVATPEKSKDEKIANMVTVWTRHIELVLIPMQRNKRFIPKHHRKAITAYRKLKRDPKAWREWLKKATGHSRLDPPWPTRAFFVVAKRDIVEGQ